VIYKQIIANTQNYTSQFGYATHLQVYVIKATLCVKGNLFCVFRVICGDVSLPFKINALNYVYKGGSKKTYFFVFFQGSNFMKN